MAFEAVGAAERLLEHGREIIAGGVCRSGHKNVVPELTFSGRPVGSGGLVAETAAHAEYGRGIQTNESRRRNPRTAKSAREDSSRRRFLRGHRPKDRRPQRGLPPPKNVFPDLTFSGRPVGSGGLVAGTAAHAEYGRGIQTNDRKRRNRR